MTNTELHERRKTAVPRGVTNSLAIYADHASNAELWDVEGHRELLTLEGTGSWFNSSAFSPDGTVLGSNTLLGRLHLWRAPSWAEIEAAERAQANTASVLPK